MGRAYAPCHSQPSTTSTISDTRVPVTISRRVRMLTPLD